MPYWHCNVYLHSALCWFQREFWRCFSILSGKKISIEVLMYTGGLLSRFSQVWCPRNGSIWPLLFLHRLSGGNGTRLSIRSWNEGLVYPHNPYIYKELFCPCTKALSTHTHLQKSFLPISFAKDFHLDLLRDLLPIYICDRLFCPLHLQRTFLHIYICKGIWTPYTFAKGFPAHIHL